MTAWVRYPPGRGNVWIPVSDGRSAAAGLSLLTFSRPLPLLAQRLLHAAVRVAGPRLLPGKRQVWSAEAGWEQALDEAAECVGPFDGHAMYLRPQHSRSGICLLLLRAGRPVGFLKVRPDDAELSREAEALRLLAGGGRSGVRTPEVLGQGAAGGLGWLLLSAMEPVPARPARRIVIGELTAALRESLGALPRRSGTPAHWEPMHGDLTPWNLRRTVGARPWLIDWEDAGYGPPGADEVYYLATLAAVRGGSTNFSRYGEAAAYWAQKVEARRDDDPALAAKLLAALRT